MKGVVKFARGDGNVELREVREPELRPGCVRVEVEACGICGTDLHILHDEYPTNPPVILGHEMSGRVVEVAADVEGVNVGDRVTAYPPSYLCGQCRHCKAGRYYLCPHRRSFGSGVDGAMARYLVVPARNLFALPENVDFHMGAMTEPVACCVRGVLDHGQPRSGDVVVVSGPGPIGLFCAQIARLTGATVVVLGLPTDAPRLEIARKLGVDHVVDVTATDPLKLVRELTDGYGADVVIEAAGAEKSAQTCLELAASGGRYVQMGLYGGPIRFDLTQATVREIVISGPFATQPTHWTRTLRLMEQGRLDPRPVITDVLPLEAWADGFGKASAKTSGKVLLKP